MAKSVDKSGKLTVVPLENRVGGVFIHVTDLMRAAEWYSRLFGLPVKQERLNGGPVYWFDFPVTDLILDTNSENRKNPSWHEGMKPRFLLPVSDIDEAYQYIEEHGKPLTEPERHGSTAYFIFRDLEGNNLMACWTEEPILNDEQPAASPILPRIGGVFVDVKDMKQAARWYSELLGQPLNEAGAEHPVYPVPVTSGAALLLDQNRHLNSEAFTEIMYLETHDFEAALEHLKSIGVELAGEPAYFDNLSEVPVLDPDGNRIVIAQMK
ncbi:VOC family protein [Paenibacillus tarimensis]|uniref:VOC family protein n=1 Tax=Paenibacillus tarimensis TaxID=416012 RepID=UPI001F2A3219|nr:VOC family protein [Paenibacillus tarimensis]MCF2944710.1 VOC family protein [Paenibacillus tarimensis]